ncbi:hypothetical protein H5410_020027 [Solanum commersonii]|uniref:Uncharacterized protein n=1 Tax=Solanum commersonii TaxID=4109 RepID=A0A9J5Z7X8_SOLCO|nr:hypothetical protein H5410_020027 [Solanum commersonii]
MNKKFLASEKEHKQVDVPISLSIDDVMEIEFNLIQVLLLIQFLALGFSQGLRTMNKKFLAFEKEHMQTDVAFFFY